MAATLLTSNVSLTLAIAKKRFWGESLLQKTRSQIEAILLDGLRS